MERQSCPLTVQTIKENNMAKPKDLSLNDLYNPSLCDKNGPIPAHNPELGNCWLWKSQTYPNGRPRVYSPVRKKFVLVSRMILECKFGALGDKQANHLCHNHECIRDSHLYRGTQKQNLADSVKDGRHESGNADLQRTLTQGDAIALQLVYLSQPTSFQQLARVLKVSAETIKTYLIENRGKLPADLWLSDDLKAVARFRKHDRPRNSAGRYSRRAA